MPRPDPRVAPTEALIEDARARFELLRRQERELDGNDIALIRAECNIQMAKCVVNLKGAAQWAAEYGERLCVALAQSRAGEVTPDGTRKAELWDHMLEVAQANGFDSITQAIVEARQSRAGEVRGWPDDAAVEKIPVPPEAPASPALEGRDWRGLIEACEPFAADARGIHPEWASERRRSSLTQDKPLTVGDFRALASALAKIKGDQK